MQTKYKVGYLTLTSIAALLSACAMSQNTGDGKDAAASTDKPGIREVADTKPQTPPLLAKQAPAKAPKPVAAVPKAKAGSKETAKGKSVAKAQVALPTAADRSVRYVTADALNVRSSPRTDAPIVGKVVHGSMLTVSVTGDWAKIGDGQFVQARFLDKGPAAAHKGRRLVSR